MTRFDLPEINLIGDKIVEDWLTENGYAGITRENLYMDKLCYLASSKSQQVIILVKTYLHPNRPAKSSEFEMDLLKRRAEVFNRVPYVAQVIVDINGEQVEEINWERLQ